MTRVLPDMFRSCWGPNLSLLTFTLPAVPSWSLSPGRAIKSIFLWLRREPHPTPTLSAPASWFTCQPLGLCLSSHPGWDFSRQNPAPGYGCGCIWKQRQMKILHTAGLETEAWRGKTASAGSVWGQVCF